MSRSAMGMPMRPAPIQPIFCLCSFPFAAMPNSLLSGFLITGCESLSARGKRPGLAAAAGPALRFLTEIYGPVIRTARGQRAARLRSAGTRLQPAAASTGKAGPEGNSEHACELRNRDTRIEHGDK